MGSHAAVCTLRVGERVSTGWRTNPCHQSGPMNAPQQSSAYIHYTAHSTYMDQRPFAPRPCIMILRANCVFADSSSEGKFGNRHGNLTQHSPAFRPYRLCKALRDRSTFTHATGPMGRSYLARRYLDRPYEVIHSSANEELHRSTPAPSRS